MTSTQNCTDLFILNEYKDSYVFQRKQAYFKDRDNYRRNTAK